ncbi:MAG: DNA translocase FtsK [Ilumatobacteraceae bacterium]|nr:DNA translocase FtsK [Ilumatobacteraceae bacterium]
MATKPRKGSQRGRAQSRPASRGEAQIRPLRSHKPVDPDEMQFRRARRPSVLKSILEGRGHEFGGIALVCLGILLFMSVYARMAGPVGRGLNTLLSWTIGVGRFVIPVLVIGAGVAFIKRTEVQHRVRLALGWTVLSIAVLSEIHILKGGGSISAEMNALSSAGGWMGWLIGEPLRQSIGGIATTILLLGSMLGGVLLITGNTLPELYRRISTWVNGVSMPQGRRDSKRRENSRDEQFDESDEPQFYDIALDDEDMDDHDDQDVANSDEEDEYEEVVKPRRERKKRKPKLSQIDVPVSAPSPTAAAIVKGVAQQMPLGPGANPSSWSLPTLDMLTVTRHEKADERATQERGMKLVEALKEHSVETELVGYTRGPTVTRFELSLGGGVKVAKVTSLSRDIAYTMAATDVRILAPIPGKSAIGIEVPNAQRELVSLGDLMMSQEARAAGHPLDVAVGKDIAGRAVFLNISTTPHMLIAGTTGAGKSSAINCIITSVLMRSTPDQVKLILIDPKQVEMAQYARLPHLLTPPVTNPKKAANALGWAVKEMERRYDLLVEAGFRDIVGYNAAYDRGDLSEEQNTDQSFDRIPYILIVVDELNDLMMVAARDVEDCITRIAQKARAVGIHLIVATQRPSVNVITGVIKANIPARMAFAVSSLTDSRVILDQPGAEKLIGKGDMLLLPGNTSVSQRIQSAWVDEAEVRKVVGHWRRQAPEVVYVSGVDGEKSGGSGADLFGGTTGDSDDDELLRQAMDLVVRTRQGSTSMLQRKLKIGFARAGRIMDLLESRGIVGPSDGSKPREVLMTLEELEQLQQAS